jgi:hypothetical protein
VGRISDDRLIQIADLDGDAAAFVGHRTKVADMAVTTNPYRRTLRDIRTDSDSSHS